MRTNVGLPSVDNHEATDDWKAPQVHHWWMRL
jgi:hypothetical protein